MRRHLDTSDNRKGLLDVVREGTVTPKSKPPTSTERLVRRAPDQVLRRTTQLYSWVGRVSLLTTVTCLLLGIWVDWRWLATAVVPLFSWGLSHQVTDHLETELDRRRSEEPGCPDRLG